MSSGLFYIWKVIMGQGCSERVGFGHLVGQTFSLHHVLTPDELLYLHW